MILITNRAAVEEDVWQEAESPVGVASVDAADKATSTVVRKGDTSSFASYSKAVNMPLR